MNLAFSLIWYVNLKEFGQILDQIEELGGIAEKVKMKFDWIYFNMIDWFNLLGI